MSGSDDQDFGGDTIDGSIGSFPDSSGTPGECCLVMIYGGELGRRVPLDQAELLVGRGGDCDLVVALEDVSRRHCVIRCDAGVVTVRDLASTNGTHVNESQIQPQLEVPLRSGDHLRFGGAIFKYLEGGNVEALYHEELYQMTIVDGLTGLYNRRYLVDFLDREIERCRRHHRPLALVMIDVDRFKSINDSYGHLAGDDLLRDLAAVLRAHARKEGCLALRR